MSCRQVERQRTLTPPAFNALRWFESNHDNQIGPVVYRKGRQVFNLKRSGSTPTGIIILRIRETVYLTSLISWRQLVQLLHPQLKETEKEVDFMDKKENTVDFWSDQYESAVSNYNKCLAGYNADRMSCIMESDPEEYQRLRDAEKALLDSAERNMRQAEDILVKSIAIKSDPRITIL